MVHDTLLRFDYESGRAYNLFVHGYRLVYYTLRSRKINRTFVDSAALTLQTVFAAIPLLALMFLMLRHLDMWDAALESIYSTMPTWQQIIDPMIEAATVAADNIPNGIFAIMGIFGLFWIIFIVFRGVENSFNHIWGVRQPRSFLKRYISYIAIVVIVPLLWGLASSLALNAYAWMGLSHAMGRGLAHILSILITATGASLLYKYLPHATVHWRYAIIAGSLVGLVLILWQWGYVYIQSYMAAYNIIYGSFAAIPLFIIWLQVSWNVILFGCELCCVWQNAERYLDIDRRRLGIKTLRLQTMLRVVVIGSGNVAEAFARTLSMSRGLEIVQLFARNEERGRAIAEMAGVEWCNEMENIAPADIYIIAVSDRAVSEVAASLVVPTEAVVVHTAGSVPIEAIPEREGGRGIIYPLQSFTSGRGVNLGEVPLFVEGSDDICSDRIMHIASLISSRVEYADSERRRTIHLAGVFVNNFVNHLYAVGADTLEREGLDFDMLKPLIMETALKAVASGDPRSVQTGPAVRGDKAVVERHIAMLEDDKLRQEIYKQITESIWETSKKI